MSTDHKAPSMLDVKKSLGMTLESLKCLSYFHLSIMGRHRN